MKSTPDLIIELRESLNLPMLRKEGEVLKAYRYLLASAIAYATQLRASTLLPIRKEGRLANICMQLQDDEDLIHSSHRLLNDKVSLVFSDPVVEQFDSRAKADGRYALMESARWESENFPLMEMSVERLRNWKMIL